MELLGFVRKEVAKKVRSREGKLQSARKDREAARALRNQMQMDFRVRIIGRPWNNERATEMPIEVIKPGPISRLLTFAATEFTKQNKNPKAMDNATVLVEAILPNQTRVNIPEKFWKKYLKKVG